MNCTECPHFKDKICTLVENGHGYKMPDATCYLRHILISLWNIEESFSDGIEDREDGDWWKR